MADLEELYREIILDHYRSPRNRGELESPPAHRVEVVAVHYSHQVGTATPSRDTWPYRLNVAVSGLGGQVSYYVYFFYQNQNNWYRLNMSRCADAHRLIRNTPPSA